MPSEKPDLLTLEQAAEAVGVSVQTFRLYVAAGSVKPDQAKGLFARAQVEKAAKLQAEAVEQARHSAVEKLAAELALIRESLIDQAENAHQIEALEKEIAADRRELADLRKLLDEQSSRLEADAAEAARAKKAFEALKSSAEETARALAESVVALGEQRNTIERLRADQGESRQRIDQLLDRLADAFFQVRSAAKPEAPAPTEPRPGGEKKTAEAPTKAAVAAPEPAVEPAGRENLPPAKFGVLREIEFNYLMERMGYRRLDSYSADELVEAGDLPVPDDDKIKDFLCDTELGCDPEEVEIAAITRGDWQMIQYQRVAKRNNKRPWIGTKR